MSTFTPLFGEEDEPTLDDATFDVLGLTLACKMCRKFGAESCQRCGVIAYCNSDHALCARQDRVMHKFECEKFRALFAHRPLINTLMAIAQHHEVASPTTFCFMGVVVPDKEAQYKHRIFTKSPATDEECETLRNLLPNANFVACCELSRSTAVMLIENTYQTPTETTKLMRIMFTAFK
jgi:hypothetical protein